MVYGIPWALEMVYGIPLDPRDGLRYTLDPRDRLMTTVYPGTRTCQELCKTRNYDVHVIVYICNYSTIHITDAKY